MQTAPTPRPPRPLVAASPTSTTTSTIDSLAPPRSDRTSGVALRVPNPAVSAPATDLEQLRYCRLCGRATVERFTKTVLHRHRVRYLECGGCGSLQTEPPTWLAEAYGASNLSTLDTGAAQRNLDNLAATFAIARLFGARDLLDIGGGDGLLCRLLRDHGLNCYVRDRYASPTYAQGFTEPDFDLPHLIVGFEVVEHFAQPAEELEALFAYRGDLVLLSTSLYRGQGADWWYLAADAGQHVFFYSERAFQQLAERQGYALAIRGGYVLFARGVSSARLRVASALLDRRSLRWLRLLLAAHSPSGVWSDHALQLDRSRRDAGNSARL